MEQRADDARKNPRLRMAQKTFNLIIIPLLALLTALAVSITAVALHYSTSLDTFLGGGKTTTASPSGTDDWDSQYYTAEYDNAEDSRDAAAAVSESISAEGAVLLKNDDTLPLDRDSEVTPFGYAYLHPVYGGYGSGDTDAAGSYIISPSVALSEYFTVNTDTVDAMEDAAVSELHEAPGTTEADAGFVVGFSELNVSLIKQYEVSAYESAANQGEGSTGVVFISRAGSEGGDEKHDAYEDGTPHYLALTQAEKDTIAFARQHCDKVVAIINSGNAMELDPLMDGEYEADAVLWVGLTGAKGFEAMAQILAGEVNPSGRTVDIYPTDLTADPTYVNFGHYEWTNATWIDSDSHEEAGKDFVEYEEGVYYGYRYYETADELGAIDYDETVTFPFGYGLSYTDFDERIVDFDADGDQIMMTVEVTNTGDVAGKQVVQAYYSAPYTEYDRDNGVEKSVVNLAAFAKSDLLEPGSSQQLELTFAKEDMASYAWRHANDDGTSGCYLLEAGEYVISLRDNSHDVIDSRTTTIGQTIVYDNGNPRQSDADAQGDGETQAATNRFDEVNDYMSDGRVTNLSRADWDGTQPTAPTDEDLVASDTVLAELADFDYRTDEQLGNVEGSEVYEQEAPVQGQDNGLKLSDMRGLDYDDPAWDDLLDQIDYSSDQLADLLFKGAYNTGELDSIGKPVTEDYDGPAGITKFFNRDDWCAWTAEVVVASTWNIDLARQMGQAVGQEALTTGVNGWYAPGMNIHRSAFGGRNFEYYSEDALLSGMMAAAVVSGAADNGLYTYIKHLAFNDQETNRQNVSVWATEQALREVYLRPFELCLKTAETTIRYTADDEGAVQAKTIRASQAIMTAQNYIGGTPVMSDYDLLTGIIRGEWGFNGLIVTDMYNSRLDWQRDRMLRAGGDIWMTSETIKAQDMDSPTIQQLIREAVHHIGYTVANSNVMQGMVPGAYARTSMAPWKIGLFAGDGVAAVLVALGVVWTVRRRRDFLAHPDRYKAARSGGRA